MPKFIENTLGMLNPADTLTTGFQNVARPVDPLEGLFTDQTTPNLVATYHTMASEYSIPQMAQFHAFDTEAQKSIPAPIDEHNVEKGLIKVKRNTSELLRQLTGRGVTEETELYDAVMDFAADLSDVAISMVRRALPDAGGAIDVPFGASQASETAGAYSQSVTLANPYGDLFITKAERRKLGLGAARAGFSPPV